VQLPVLQAPKQQRARVVEDGAGHRAPLLQVRAVLRNPASASCCYCVLCTVQMLWMCCSGAGTV
jgi:hypothetical protein